MAPVTVLVMATGLTVFLAVGRIDAADPTSIPRDLEQARSELAEIQEKQKALEAHVAEAHADEVRLEKLIQELKQNQPGLTQPLQELRLDRAMRQLRDRLLEIQELRREQQRLKDKENRSRERIRNALRQSADERLKEAERLFKAGQEQQANILYQQALGLMEEYQHLSEAVIPPIVYDTPAFDPPITGRESADELHQFSVLLRHEAEEASQELKYLEQAAQRVQSDLAFEERSLRFQGIRERETEPGTGPSTSVTDREAALNRQLTGILKRIKEKRARIQHFLERADELEKLAAGKNPMLERKNP
ncbi:MAG: hypothetical protein HY203_06730 [Nitrospirae bacterium]|nr:hypothetical protein [Nitrospirota bacterium]